MKLILALCAAALVSAATENSISPRNSVPTGAIPDPIYGSDNLGNIDYETVLFGSVASEDVQRLAFTDGEMSAYANQFENWLTSRREGRIYPAGIDEIINDTSIVGGKEVFNLTDERRTYFNNLLRDLVDVQTQKDVFNLPPGPAATPGAPGTPGASTMPAASTQSQPPRAGADGSGADGSSSGSSSSSSTSAGNQPGATVPTGMPGFPGNSSDDDITSSMSSAANGTSLNGTDAAGFNGTNATGLNGTNATGLNGTDALGSAGSNSTGNGTTTSRNSTGSGAAGRNGTRNDTVSSRTSAAGAARAVQEWTIAGGIAAAALCLLS
ncbi:hypothetical protein OXX80_009354 [Metschnikowia pulcherrima]